MEPLSRSSDIIWTRAVIPGRAALHNKHIIWTTQILSTQPHSSPAFSSLYKIQNKTCLSAHVDLHELILKLKEWWLHQPGRDLLQWYICVPFPWHLIMFWLRKLLLNNDSMRRLQKQDSSTPGQAMVSAWFEYLLVFSNRTLI